MLTLIELDAGCSDAGELFEMARDRRRRRDADRRRRTTSTRIEKAVADMEFRRMFSNPMDPQQLLPRHPGRAPAAPKRRTGRRCCSACTSGTASARASASKCWKSPTATSPASRARRSRSPANTPSASCAPKPACTAWCANRRSIPNARRHTSFCQRVRLSRSGRLDRDRDQSGRPAHRHLSRLAAPAASTSTRPIRRCASRTSRPASSCSARTTARSTATAPKRWRC